MIPARNLLLVMALLAAAGGLLQGDLTRAVPMNRPFGEFPRVHAGWRMQSEEVFSAGVLEQLRPTDYLARNYAGPGGRTVNLYVGYHDGGEAAGEIHSPRHCLPGNGFNLLSSRTVELDLGGRRLAMVRAVYQRGAEKTLFLYWYQLRDRAVTGEVGLKVAEVVNALLHGRKDAAFVRVAVGGYQDDNGVEAAGLEFVRAFEPLIREFLPG